MGLDGRDVEDALRELLLTPVPKGRRAPEGEAQGGAVYFHADRRNRQVILSEGADSHEAWRDILQTTIENALPLPHAGSYSVWVTSTGKVTGQDLYRTGSIKVTDDEDDDEAEVGGVGGMSLRLSGDLADLTEAHSAKMLIGSLDDLARAMGRIVAQTERAFELAGRVLDNRNKDLDTHARALLDQARQMEGERLRLLDLVDDVTDSTMEWERTKMKVIEEAPGKLIELGSLIKDALAERKEGK